MGLLPIGVEFRDSLEYTADHAHTILDCYEANAAYAGIHDVEYRGDVDNPWTNDALWRPYDTGIWTLDENGLTGVAGGSQAYIFSDPNAPNAIRTPFSFVMNMSADGPGGGFLFRVADTANYFWLRWTTSYLSFERVSGGASTIITRIPKSFTGAADIKVMCREYQYTSIATDRWLLMAAWIDGEYILGAAYNIYGVPLGDSIGFTVEPSSSLSWTEIFMPVLSMPVDWSSMDPGETPFASIQRAVGERHIRTWMRFNGHMKLWRPRKAEISFQFTNSQYEVKAIEQDMRQIINHVRQWGAFHRAEVFDADLVRDYGRRFQEVNNPNLFTQRECYDEARIVIDNAKAEATRLSFTAPFNPFLEVEDVVQTPDGKRWIVDSIDMNFRTTDVQMNVNGRAYVYE